MDNWKAMTKWKKDQLLKVQGKTYFKTNGSDDDGRRLVMIFSIDFLNSFQMTFADYVSYMEQNHDDKPIYLFDNKFFVSILNIWLISKVESNRYVDRL